jgi:hypothetical protein
MAYGNEQNITPFPGMLADAHSAFTLTMNAQSNGYVGAGSIADANMPGMPYKRYINGHQFLGVIQHRQKDPNLTVSNTDEVPVLVAGVIYVEAYVGAAKAGQGVALQSYQSKFVAGNGGQELDAIFLDDATDENEGVVPIMIYGGHIV